MERNTKVGYEGRGLSEINEFFSSAPMANLIGFDLA
jgi:hypothetical protein